MATCDEKKNRDFYDVLGLKKDCSATELKDAYKKLALRWHPDRCSTSGSSKQLEESKKKFQDIQEAYSVLSDSNKRFLYDVGAYDSDDDENEMGDFLDEMAAMMKQNKPNGNREESFEDLQGLFNELFQNDYGEAFPSSSSSSSSSSGPFASCSQTGTSNMNLCTNRAVETSSFKGHFSGFCLGAGGRSYSGLVKEDGRSKRKNSRKGGWK